MKFTPREKQPSIAIPMLDDLRAEDGWQGMRSNQSLDELRTKVQTEIGRLSGKITSFIEGDYEIEGQTRPGYTIRFIVAGPDGSAWEGRIDMAGPPFEMPFSGDRTHSGFLSAFEKRREQSLRMCLFNANAALVANRNLEKLSPGFAALMPWMLGKGDLTIGQIWRGGAAALPAPGGKTQAMKEADDE
jgi:hypothetical protein